MLLLVVVVLHLAMVLRTESIRYTRLFNPVLIFLPLLVGYTLVARLGVAQAYFYPRYSPPHLACCTTSAPTAATSRRWTS
jgi:hypothetical protein